MSLRSEEVRTLLEEEMEKRTGCLDLGRTGLTHIPGEVITMHWLKELILGNDDNEYPGYESKTTTKNHGPHNSISAKEIIKVISNLHQIKLLALHDLKLGYIPVINGLQQLEVLDLDGNGISDIDDQLKFFPVLKTLYLGNNNLNKTPELNYLENLETLHLNLNQLTEVKSLGTLKKLKELVLVGNSITSLTNLPDSLEKLDLSENRINTQDGIDISKLRFLKELNLSTNNLSQIPDVKNLRSLETLILSRNQISIIKNLEKLVTLTTLNLNDNVITEVENLQALHRLKNLYLSNNKINEIKNLDNLKNLELLFLYSNNISEIKNLERLTKLSVLDLSNNNISDINSLPDFPVLEALYLDSNQISDIKKIFNFTSLKRVNISKNNIEALPENIPHREFTNIILSSNKIADLTPLKEFIKKGMKVSLETPKNSFVQGIFVSNNPLSIPSAEVIAQGNSAVLRYFASLEQTKADQLQEFKSKEVKLILLGNSNVGKTHLAKYLISNRTELPQRSVSTHGMNFHKFTYNYISRPLENVTVRLFDFGGQEYYHDTHHLFFTEDTAYFLLWEKGSNYFGETESERYHSDEPGAIPVKETNYNFPVVYWLDAMNSIMKDKRKDFFGEKSLEETNTTDNTIKLVDVIKLKNLILVETKRGKDGNGLINTNDFIRYEPLVHSSASLELQQLENTITAKGINNLLENFEEIIDKLVEKTWSAYFGFVHRFFVELKETPNKKEVIERIEEAAIKDKLLVTVEECQVLFNIILQNKNTNYTFAKIEQVEDMCRFLANRGYIIYQNNMQICLYPEELTEKIYSILSKPQTGIISKKAIETKSGKDCTQLLDLMQEYRLLIPHTSLVDTFIAPQNLPDTADETVKLFLNSFQKPALRYRLNGYIHKNTILEIFFAFKEELIKDVSNNYFWKNGLIIKMSSIDNLFKIEFVQNETERFITISSLNQQKDYTSFIEVEAKVEALLKQRSFEKEISIDGIDFVNYTETEKNALKNNAVFIQHDKHYRVADYKTFLRRTVKEYFMKKLFISYSSKDSAFMRRFVTHLDPLKREGIIDIWHDRMIEPGARWDDTIKEEMDSSDIIVFLLSPDFLATSYVFDIEIPKALERLENGQSKIFLVLLNPCGWDKSDLKAYQLTFDSAATAKDIITIKEPGNDTAWNKIIYELEEKIKLK